MRACLVCVCVLLVAGICSPQKEDMTRGSYLLGSCQITVRGMDNAGNFSNDNIVEAYRNGMCRGLIEGVSDVSPKVCPPDEVTNGQEFRVVLKYLEDHPEELHVRHTVLIEEALVKAFPCHGAR